LETLISVEVLKDGHLIVWSIEESRRLYNTGFYGKPLGNPKPKEDFDEPLILDPVEGVYLLQKGLISVFLGEKRKKVTLHGLIKVSKASLENFDDKYRVYTDLRERGFIATPGIKYGCDFVVYEHGPGIDHAPYLIQVRRRINEMTAADIVKAGRLASTVRKTFIIAIVSKDSVSYIEFKWWRA
jgi:tRNA-intron endonuclease